MKRHCISFIVFLFALTTWAQVVSVNEVINPHVASVDDYVSDMAKVFTPAEEAQVNKLCKQIENKADIQMLVVTVPSIGDRDPFQYSVDLFQRIGVGGKESNRGILILLSVQEKKWQIRTGYGVEGRFTDAICSQIGRNKMVPEFKKGNYSKGLTDAVGYILILATSDDAMAELKGETEAAEAALKMRKTRENLNYFWILIALWCAVAFAMYYFNKPSKKQSNKPVTDVVKSDNTIPLPYIISKEVGNHIYVQQNPKAGKLEYWDKDSITRSMIYFIGPAIATGAACEVTFSMGTLLPMILLCNTWVALNYIFARERKLKKTESQYEKKLVYEDGFSGPAFWISALIAPWVTLPAAIAVMAKKRKYRDVMAPCPKCGGNLTPLLDNDIIKSRLSTQEQKEMEIGSRKFKLMMCEHGHDIVEAVTVKGTKYHVCSHCGARAGKYQGLIVKEKATTSKKGLQINTYQCLCCGEMFEERVVLSRLETEAERQRRLEREREREDNYSYSSSDSSSSSGSYGGGSTGGGGAGGSW